MAIVKRPLYPTFPNRQVSEGCWILQPRRTSDRIRIRFGVVHWKKQLLVMLTISWLCSSHLEILLFRVLTLNGVKVRVRDSRGQGGEVKDCVYVRCRLGLVRQWWSFSANWYGESSYWGTLSTQWCCESARLSPFDSRGLGRSHPLHGN